MEHVEALCDMGPRYVGSPGNDEAADYIAEELDRRGWKVSRQTFTHRGEELTNVVGKKGQGPLIILGTHYDTRPIADRDPSDRSAPVLGANDGGSGTGVLLELARSLDKAATQNHELWLVFFDGEDRGDIDGWDWSVGAGEFAQRLNADAVRPEYVIVVDMVGDREQQIYYEWSSSTWLNERIWQQAAALGYDEYFVPKPRYSIVDDHAPFLEVGIVAALIIDFDYRYWHTQQDTLDKISADSLQRVGDVLEAMLEDEPTAIGSQNQ